MSLEAMRKKYLGQKQLGIVTGEENPSFSMPGIVSVATAPHRLVVDINPEVTPVAAVMTEVLKSFEVHDLTINDLPLEEVIKGIYGKGRAA